MRLPNPINSLRKPNAKCLLDAPSASRGDHRALGDLVRSHENKWPGSLPDFNLNQGENMYVLTDTTHHLVSGGHGNSTNSGSSTATTQSCTRLPNGGTQCTSGNGRSMVIQSYDRNGNLINSTQCTENRSASINLGNKAISGGVQGGGGTSCSSSRPSAPASSPASGNYQLVIQMPYQGSL
jgi:hypothetical protein